MSGVNLPHDHGQNIEKVLERMPDSEECVLVAEVFKQISDGSRIRILWLLPAVRHCGAHNVQRFCSPAFVQGTDRRCLDDIPALQPYIPFPPVEYIDC